MKKDMTINGIFKSSRQLSSVRKPISPIIVTGAVILLGLFMAPVWIKAQRLCEHNDNPVAKIAPCFGAVGTVLTVTPGRRLPAALGQLVFKRTLTNLVPAQVITQISNGAATIPPQLCTAGNGRWEVWLVLANNQSQGKIGAFTTAGCVNGQSSGLGQGQGSNSNNAPAPKIVILPPIVMNVDNEVYAKTQNSSQSYIKNIASSIPEVATGTEWGTNEVKIRGKKVGVTTISFFDDNTGTTYRVEVTVKKKPLPGPGGNGAIKPQEGSLDPCLVGEWRAVKTSGLVEGGTDFRLTIKADGTQLADYSSMKILTLKDLTYRYGGASEGVLTAQNGSAQNISVKKAGVTLATGNIDGESAPKPSSGMGPGALGTNKNNNSYTCTDQTLTFSTEDFQGKEFLEITMERVTKSNKTKSSSQSNRSNLPKPKPIKNNATDKQTAGGKLDPCLVGDWVSESIDNEDRTHGSGILLSIEKTGKVTIDYSGMNPSPFGSGTSGARGKAVVQMRSVSNRLYLEKIVESQVTRYWTANGNTRTEDDPYGGNAVPLTTEYTCTGDTFSNWKQVFKRKSP